MIKRKESMLVKMKEWKFPQVVRMTLVVHLLMKKVMIVKAVVAVAATLKIVLQAVVKMKKVLHRVLQRIKRKSPRK